MRKLIVLIVLLFAFGCGSEKETKSYPIETITFNLGAYVGVAKTTVVFSDNTIHYMHLLVAGGTTVPIYLYVIPNNAAIGDRTYLKTSCYVLGVNDFEQVDTSATVVLNGVSYDAYVPTKGKQP
jgi:hypothetical protein